ncbi:growth hormone secretagogue receptor type 1-like [Penaeus indicus]|uniref:growth hormone secretagogue receptor type 1-like n=1 Tax=Penaeus indicus TaxID=29960 RepID=UPI00300D059D
MTIAGFAFGSSRPSEMTRSWWEKREDGILRSTLEKVRGESSSRGTVEVKLEASEGDLCVQKRQSDCFLHFTGEQGDGKLENVLRQLGTLASSSPHSVILLTWDSTVFEFHGLNSIQLCLPMNFRFMNRGRETESKIVPYVELSVVHASVLSLLVISLERYHVICQPLQAGYRCTRAKATAAIAVIWTLAFLSAGPMLRIVQYDYVKYYDGSTRPNCITPIETLWNKSYIIASSVLFFFVPLLLLVGLYSVIARQLLIDTYELTHKKENPQMRARRQVVIMLATVVVFFFLCLMPMRVLYLWIIAVPLDTITWLGIEGYYNLLYFCRIMHYLNSSINPILYNMTSTKFRAAFTRVFNGRRLQRHDTYSNTSYNNHTVTNNLRVQYGTNCSMVYKTMYSKTVVSHKYSYTSTGSASTQVTRHASLVSASSLRPSTKDSFV